MGGGDQKSPGGRAVLTVPQTDTGGHRWGPGGGRETPRQGTRQIGPV